MVFWFGDERFVAPDSPDRNALQAREAFLDAVGADPANVHDMPSTADAADVDAGAAAYAETLRTHGGGEFDIVMLGIGPDGHIASLFPGFPQLDVDDIAVGVTGSPKPPPERISLTFACLNRAKSVWFLVSGDGQGRRRRPAPSAAPTATTSPPPASPATRRRSGSSTAGLEPLCGRVTGPDATTGSGDASASAAPQPVDPSRRSSARDLRR